MSEPTKVQRRAFIKRLEQAIGTLEGAQHMLGAKGIDLANAKSELLRRLSEAEKLST